MKKIHWQSLITILLPLVLGSIVGFITRNDVSNLDYWHRTIIPPKFLFPVVWTILYLLMGFWLSWYEKNISSNDKNVRIFWIQFLLNLAFSPALFTFQKIKLATGIVVLLIILVGYLCIQTFKKDKKSVFFLLPYFLWLCFALVLMIDLLVQNANVLF